jgi:hypothetical protein
VTPDAPPRASPFLEFDLTGEVDRLHRETTRNTGQNARTLMKYDDFRVVLTALKARACAQVMEVDGFTHRLLASTAEGGTT